jgi:PAS domain S-box-containing protein
MSAAPSSVPRSPDERVLVLAPHARDNSVATDLLSEGGLFAQKCGDLAELVAELASGAGCAVITREAVLTADLRPLLAWLDEQPLWSDLPIVIITKRGAGSEGNPGALRLMDALGNVTFLERPFRPLTFLSLVQSALRSRRRQLEARVQMAVLSAREAAFRDSEERLRELNETLEQQVAERAARLRVSEASVRAIFETSFQAQGLLSPDGTLLEANTASLTLIDAKLEDVTGHKLWETPWFAPTPGMPAIIRDAIENAARGESFRQEISVTLAGGLRVLDISFRPIRDETGNVVAILPEAADITGRLRAEEALRQAQKMEAVGQLTGGIAHDFNNMLQGIAGGVELMRRRIRDGRPEEAEQYVDASKQSIERAAALVQRLLAFSRRQALTPKRVDLDGLIHEMTNLMRQTVGPGIKVRVGLKDSSWAVRCDPNQMESALLNLAINARDAMAKGGGELVVRTEHVHLDDADVAGWASAQPGDYVKISVSDSGIGMSRDVMEHAFEPFFTTKPVGQGTGLGLSQVFGFVSQSDGIVRIDSQVGKGTSIQLFLPRDLEPGEGEAWPGRAAIIPRSSAPTIVLLVEDEADLRRLAAEALRDSGCTVLEAKDGPTGLSVLRSALSDGGGNVDILVSDVGLPGGLNGRQLADAARAISPDLPVLLITGYAGEALASGLPQDDHIELLSKPFALDVLAARVEAIVSSQTKRGHASSPA